jgi:hypothetical protein
MSALTIGSMAIVMLGAMVLVEFVAWLGMMGDR